MHRAASRTLQSVKSTGAGLNLGPTFVGASPVAAGDGRGSSGGRLSLSRHPLSRSLASMPDPEALNNAYTLQMAVEGTPRSSAGRPRARRNSLNPTGAPSTGTPTEISKSKQHARTRSRTS